MKKLKLTLIAALTCACAYAQQNALNSTGNVGIGTTAPGTTMDVVGTGRFTSVVNATSGTGTEVFYSGGAGYIQGYNRTASTFVPMNIQGSSIGFSNTGIASTNPSMIILGGKVGIGNTTPSAKLDVNGNVNTSSYMTSSLGFYMNITGDGINNNIGNGYLSFRTKNVDNRMIIDPNGNVGINTINTQGYQFAVNGSAIATSMTVKLYANWPDYVFNSSYKLLPLQDLKTYIDQHQHLPEVPSEQEVTSNGLNLGEMNKLLTKKIEELTLYLIEIDKKEKEQQAINIKLEEKLKVLEAKMDNLYKQKND
jgi:hypothetical protein